MLRTRKYVIAKTSNNVRFCEVAVMHNEHLYLLNILLMILLYLTLVYFLMHTLLNRLSPYVNHLIKSY